ncbi:MAG: RHS repeat-associated core domain-containing protein [Brevundimonas sp.]|nr:RHS repeat-associated core domain-containing protein [Brevundimonas sp.]MDZ4061609.1 RHS repeat-associated core domain-containing protein [Brevundimonas sp.]
MNRRTLKTWLFAATSGVALAAGAAQAQTAPLPPEHYTLDPQGVDLVSGDFPLAVEEVSIGQPGNGLSYGRVLLGNQWRDVTVGGINCSGTSCTVAVDGSSEVFDQTSPGVWISTRDTGSTLVFSGGVYTYTRAGGTVWRISTPGVDRYGFELGVSQKTEPNGLKTEYTYTTAGYCAEYDPENNCGSWQTVSKIRSYQNNTGHQIHYEYANEIDPADGGYYLVTKVTGINGAVDYCYAGATSCTGLTQVWPSVTYATTATGGGFIDTVTDQGGRVTQYEFLSGGAPPRLVSVTLPGMSTPQVQLTWDLGLYQHKVSQVVGPTGQWDYTFVDSGTTRTTNVSGPLSQGLTVVTDLTVGQPSSATLVTSVSPAASQTWSWTYNAGGRVATATGPEGETSSYVYDGRGNITQVTHAPKTGGTEAALVTSATYPSSCTNPVTCNLPLTTTDAAGNVTDYTWDSAHGGPLTITAPAPTSGADRPQTRMSYGSFHAYVKTGSGSIAPWSTPVILPTVASACATGTSCIGTANEVRTTVGYGSTGVANNLLPASISRGSGANPSMAVTAMTYTPEGDIATVDGPLPGSADTTAYRYDGLRRVIGVVGPDPDGGGAGLNRAQRLTYNGWSQVTLSETGTTPGYTDTNWASFNPLVRSATIYDALGRPLVISQQSGAGTTVGVQQISYDAAGRPDCTAVRMNPSAWGSLPTSACTATTAGSDGPDRIRRMTYDAAGRPLSATSAYGLSGVAATTSVTYDANGRVASLTDGAGNVSIQQYDGFNRPSVLRYPNPTGGGTSTTDYEQVTYDAYGRMASHRGRAAQTTTLTVDNLGRVTNVDAPSGTMDLAYTYDNLGRVLTTAGGGQTLNNVWDALSRLTSETGLLGAMSYQYDARGGMTRITWPDTFYAQYDRDVSGAVTAIRENGASSGSGVLAVYAYNNLGQPTGITRGDGTTTAYAYDAAGRMTSLDHNMAGSGSDVTFGYTWNPAGQIAARSVSNAAYVYAPNTGSTSYVNNSLNQVTSAGGTSVTYDANQNTASALGSSYGYDGANRLTSATIGGTGYTFGYDPAGRLYSGGGYFQYAGLQLVGEYNGSGVLQTRHVPGPGLDQPVATWFGSARIQQIADERGSVVGTADASGSVNINRYDEYGVPSAGNRFQYTGQAWMAPGIYNYRARAYAPQLGRFLQTDPIGYAAGPNVYGYVRGDPVNRVDPFGLQDSLADVTVQGERCPEGTRREQVFGTNYCLRNNTTPPTNINWGPAPQPSGDNRGDNTGDNSGSRSGESEEPTEWACGIGLPNGQICGRVTYSFLCSGAKQRLAAIAALTAADVSANGVDTALRRWGNSAAARFLAIETMANNIDVMMYCR